MANSHRSASERLQEVSFPLAVRGYERGAVDDFVDGVRALVAELEATQTREGVVQKAIDDVGVETASILQRAHETADELTSRSRAQADDRLQRAEREADQVRREADEYSEQIVADTRLLWEERQRLIEDIRQLADEVLATADDAIERVKIPEPLAAAELDPEPTTAEGPTTGPVGVPAAERYALGEDEDEPLQDESGTYERGDESEPYGSDAFEDDSLDADTAPYRLGAVEDEPPDEVDPPSSEEESGHTVELEALPGGAGAEAGAPDAPQQDSERGWDRERD
jgi:hypothetical protein